MVAVRHITRVQKIGEIAAVTFLMLVPFAASAQVVINEIAWMGTTVSVNAEWMELFNNGNTAVDLAGWHLIAANGSPSITLSGTITANGYFLLERTSDASVPTVTANQIYTGALTNSGTTLTLTDTSSSVIDQVDGGVNWANVGGDNTSKETAQKTVNGWTTATSTPGAVNASTVPPVTTEDSGSQTSSQTQTTQAPTSSYVAPPEPQIFADAGDNRTVIVAADTEFLGRAYNRKKETVSGHIRFLWNFGDGSIAEGQSVMHHFEYPGRYVVVLNIAENTEAASDRIIVTAEPAKLAFTAHPDGSVTIGNHAGRDLDMSGWIVRSFGRSFVVPKDSIILAGELLRIGDKTLGFRSAPETELDYPNGALALKAGSASEGSEPKESDTTAVPAIVVPSPARSVPAAIPPYSEQSADETGAPSSETENAVSNIPDTSASSSQTAAAGATVSNSGISYLWWFGAIGMAVVGGGAVVASRRAGKREWDIVEEKEG
ncbi:MAG: lamin tail domain-containing protein [bacterium]|nr:lamin tail domain-containing protein [bacterium]